MPFDRMFDEEVDRAAVEGCLNDGDIQGVKTYVLSLSNSSSHLSDVAPGIYRVFLDGLSPSATVLLRVGRASDSLTSPTSASPASLSMFPGSDVVRIRVLPGNTFVSARMLTGTGDLYFVPVVAL